MSRIHDRTYGEQTADSHLEGVQELSAGNPSGLGLCITRYYEAPIWKRDEQI